MVDLDVFPRELLADPVEARVRDHLDLTLAFFWLDFLLQKRVHAKRIHVIVLEGRVGFRVRLLACEAREVLPEAEHLLGRFRLAGDIPEQGIDLAVKVQVGGQRQQCRQPQRREDRQRAQAESEQGMGEKFAHAGRL